MNNSKMVCGFILVAVTTFSSFAQASAAPVLIKLSLEKSSDYENANILGVRAYHRFDNFVLAELEKDKLGELDRVGLEYHIIDENPWSEPYFLVSLMERVAKGDVKLYGEVLLEDIKWQLIKSSREKASELGRMGHSVIPIHHNPIPLKYEHPAVLPKAVPGYSVSIDSLLSLISSDSLCSWDVRLQDFKTRYSYSDSIIKARDWLYDKFINFGIDSVWLHPFYYNSDQWNVVATIPGTARPDRVIVVGAHYDSFVYSGPESDPLVWAPGADDNASGTVATLQMAKIIAANPLPVTVMFVTFAQEEEGLYGSYFFAQYLHDQGTDVKLMINSDMIGYSVDPDPDVEINSAQKDLRFSDVMIATANTYTYLCPFYGGQSFSSDHESFYQRGYHAVSTFEGDYNTSVHTNYDLAHILNYDYLKEVVKMCLASLIVVANSPSSVESLRVVMERDGNTAHLSWSASDPTENVVHYKVYFGTASGRYDSLHEVGVTCDTLRGLMEDTTYFVTVTAINSDSLESLECQELSFKAFPVTLDQGILLVDETYINGFDNMVDSDGINAFYERALEGYTYARVDYSCPPCTPQNQLRIKELVRYSPVIVHSEDNRGSRSLGGMNDSTYLNLKEYLRKGGKVIIEGRRNLSSGNDGEEQIREFSSGDVPYDYLKVKSAYVPPWSTTFYRTEEFIGAFSQISGYPDLQVDSLRVEQCSEGVNPPLAGKVPGVGYIDSLMAGEIIYRFHSAYDTSISEGKPVAFRYSGTDYKLVYFDFPLYFIQESQACSLLHRALSDLGIHPSLAEEDEESKTAISFSLKQNFPNPFNSETVIEYSLHKENQVKVTIYNLLGQKVRVLLDQRELVGYRKVIWDGKNDKGEVVTSGIYFCRMEAGAFVQTKKLVLLK